MLPASEYEKQIKQLTFEKQAKVVEQQGKLQQIAVQHQADMELEHKKLLTQLAVAEVATKYQNEADRESDRRALISQFHEQAHEQGMAAQQTQQAMPQLAAGSPHISRTCRRSKRPLRASNRHRMRSSHRKLQQPSQ
jgi:hypothetical protein